MRFRASGTDLQDPRLGLGQSADTTRRIAQIGFGDLRDRTPVEQHQHRRQLRLAVVARGQRNLVENLDRAGPVATGDE